MESNQRDGDPIRTASRVRHWAVLGSRANVTQFGLQRYLRRGAADPTTAKYLGEGRALFVLLQQGEEVTNTGVKSGHQLAALNALEPIRPSGAEAPVLKPEEISNVVETIDAILNGEKPERTLVEQALDHAFKASDAYAKFAFNEIDIREKEYTNPNAVQA